MFETQTPYLVPLTTRFYRVMLRPTFRGLFHLLSKIIITGVEHVPRRGPYLIAINHVSLYEPPFVLAFWPVAAEAVGAVDIWKRRGQASIARLYGGIQVHRGEYDRQLLDAMLAVLHAGRPLLIAPEGGRSHSPGMRRAFPGVAYVMEKAQAPVVPVGVFGATDDFLQRGLHGDRPRLEMRIGYPVRLPPVDGKGEARRASLQRNADLIMTHIAALLPPEYHGVYADHNHPSQETA